MSAREHAAIALLSGGLDSVTALALWRARGHAIVRCLTFDYGQRAAAREIATAARLCERFSLAHDVIALPWLAALARAHGCALVGERALPQGTAQQPGDERSAAAVWVPARNAVFVAIAGAHAETHGAGVVLAGFNREEAATFRDNSADFVAAASAFLQWGTRDSVRVESPTLALDKAAIVRAARELGLGPNDTWSCYTGEPSPCGRCESCLRSARAWATA